MPIHCPCGTTLKVPKQVPGKLRCPSCGRVHGMGAAKRALEGNKSRFWIWGLGGAGLTTVAALVLLVLARSSPTVSVDPSQEQVQLAPPQKPAVSNRIENPPSGNKGNETPSPNQGQGAAKAVKKPPFEPPPNPPVVEKPKEVPPPPPKKIVQVEPVNRPPRIRIVGLGPKVPQAGSSYQIAVEVEDPDGDQVQVEYSWDTKTFSPLRGGRIETEVLQPGYLLVVVRATDTRQGRTLETQRWQVLPAPVPPLVKVTALVFSPDSSTLFVQGALVRVVPPHGNYEYRRYNRLVEVATGKELWRNERSTQNTPPALDPAAFSEDGLRIHTIHRGEIKMDYLAVWDAASGKKEKETPLPGRLSGRVWLDTARNRLLHSEHRVKFNILDLTNGSIIRSFSLGGKVDEENDLLTIPNVRAIDAAGTHGLGGAGHYTLRWYDLENGLLKKTLHVPEAKEIPAVVNPFFKRIEVLNGILSPDGKKALVTLGPMGNRREDFVQYLDLETGRKIHHLPLKAKSIFEKPLQAMVFTPDGKTALFSRFFQIHFWDLETGKERIPRTHEAKTRSQDLIDRNLKHGVHVLAVSPDGRWVCSGISGRGGDIMLLDLSSWK